MFSKLKYVNAPNFEKFRGEWNAKFLDGFIAHSKAFDGLKGNFPIGFLIWKTNQLAKKKTPIDAITTEIIDKSAKAMGDKNFYNLPNDDFLSKWLPRLKTDSQNIPLKNAVTPQTKHAKVTAWVSTAIGYMYCNSNDLQNAATQTAITSSVFSTGNGFYIVPENLWQAAIVFSVRRLIKPTWINDRDQFLQPTGELPDAFKHDCLIWMLFSGSNLSASADGLEWDDRTWSIVNYFIPFTEAEVNAPDRFESDFMVQYLVGKKLSKEAKRVMKEGRELWKAYFAHTDVHAVRDALKLNRSDVGWYQIRTALKRRNASGDYVHVDFTAFDKAYGELGDELRPQVFDLGFLKA
jgi:hypothetical protein